MRLDCVTEQQQLLLRCSLLKRLLLKHALLKQVRLAACPILCLLMGVVLPWQSHAALQSVDAVSAPTPVALCRALLFDAAGILPILDTLTVPGRAAQLCQQPWQKILYRDSVLERPAHGASLLDIKHFLLLHGLPVKAVRLSAEKNVTTNAPRPASLHQEGLHFPAVVLLSTATEKRWCVLEQEVGDDAGGFRVRALFADGPAVIATDDVRARVTSGLFLEVSAAATQSLLSSK